MKKVLFIIFLILLCFSLFAAKIENIERPEDIPLEIKGSPFFPLFLGAQWEFDVEGLGTLDKIVWEVTDLYKITDWKYKLKNTLAYKIKIEAFEAEWFALESAGFVCFYRVSGNKNVLEKIIPIEPEIDQNWKNGNDQLKVGILEENMLKIELANEKENKYGYQMFLKDMGPFEIFEYIALGDEETSLRMTLISNVTFNDAYYLIEEKIAELEAVKAESETTEEAEEEVADVEETEETPEVAEVIDVPVETEETIVEEPVIEEPITEEPIIEETIEEVFVVDEPTVIETEPTEEGISESWFEEEEPTVEEIVEPETIEPVEIILDEPIEEVEVIEPVILEIEEEEIEPIVEEPLEEEIIEYELEEPVIEEPIIEEPVIEELIIEEPIIEEPEIPEVDAKDYIRSLKKGDRFIQIGAFSIEENAIVLFWKVRDMGHGAKILKDRDGLFKVLVQISGDEDKFLKKIRYSIAPDAFKKYR